LGDIITHLEEALKHNDLSEVSTALSIVHQTQRHILIARYGAPKQTKKEK